MEKLNMKLAELVKGEEGATAVEYGVMVALIIAVIIGVVAAIGDKLLTAFTSVDTQLGPAPGGN
jgi:pilus assembly protein Flp/PilA